MSEQKNGYMAQLDQWTAEQILRPIHDAWHEYYAADNSEAAEETTKRLAALEIQVKKVVREKVLESYRNGQKAGLRSKNKQEK